MKPVTRCLVLWCVVRGVLESAAEQSLHTFTIVCSLLRISFATRYLKYEYENASIISTSRQSSATKCTL